MIQLGGFLGRLLGTLLRTGLPLMKSIYLRIKILGSGQNTALIISNDEM